ncbi:UDP-D-xylose:L-fucose alpha-1,3-D-xylosyltransferase MGP4-like isoform X3 [Pomacea canaliculata]|nr:UDP-D-xylose:L-fucose alpha-1,3-D-xylosyltransferase MGP4-like isoform X3 [Pomacea canaliculata]
MSDMGIRRLHLCPAITVVLLMCLVIYLADLFHNNCRYGDAVNKADIRDPSLSVVASAAKKLLDEHPLLVTVINHAYLPLMYNWMCHTKRFQGLHDRLLVLAEDKQSLAQFTQRWPGVRSMTINSQRFSLGGQLPFNTVGYVRMMVLRTEVLNELVQSNLPFVLFETDFVWLRNPVPDFLELAFKEELDLVGSKSAVEDQIMCGGFIYFRNTEHTRLLWAEVTRKMHSLEDRMKFLKDNESAPKKENEQRYLNALLAVNYEGVRYGLVDYNTSVVDGKWYTNKILRRRTSPKAIHNNFLTTTREKIIRFKAFGQWFLKSDDSCDDEKLQHHPFVD